MAAIIMKTSISLSHTIPESPWIRNTKKSKSLKSRVALKFLEFPSYIINHSDKRRFSVVLESPWIKITFIQAGKLNI